MISFDPRRIFVSLLLLAASAAAALAQGQEVIIESRQGGKNADHYSEPAGVWLDSQTPPQKAKSGAPDLTPQGQIGSRKYPLRPGTTQTLLAVARFAPKFETPGRYYVYATWPDAANLSPVDYVVKHASGETKKSLAQDGWGHLGNPNSNAWVLLGDYEFTKDADQGVEMRIPAEATPTEPRNAGQAYADAIRFSPKPLGSYLVPTAPAVRGSAPGLGAGAARTATPGGPYPRSSSNRTPAPQPTDVSGLPAEIKGAPTPRSVSVGRGATEADLEKETYWVTTLEQARTRASAENKRIFAFFFSPESARTRTFDREILVNNAVRSVLAEKYICVRINMMEEQSLANRLGVFKAGTINLYDAAGSGLDQILDVTSAQDLAVRLNRY